MKSMSASKKQLVNAKTLFGAKHQSIVKKLEELSKQKLLETTNIDGFLLALKTLTPESAEKLKNSASGKKVLANFKAIATAKSFDAIMKAVQTAKLPKALQNTMPLVKKSEIKATDGGDKTKAIRALATAIKKNSIPSLRTRETAIKHGIQVDLYTVNNGHNSQYEFKISATPRGVVVKYAQYKTDGRGAFKTAKQLGKGFTLLNPTLNNLKAKLAKHDSALDLFK